MKLWMFQNEPGVGYYFCTKEPSSIYKDNMRGVVYTNYGKLIGCIPTLTFDRLFPALKFEGGSYRKVEIEKTLHTPYIGEGYWIRKDNVDET